MIWQAGRATCATGLAFKPIQVGQSVFIDEGSGKYNPSPQIVDEAVLNEWPGREIGVFVTIGTGKRSRGSATQEHEWWEGLVGGGMGDFAEARRRLMSKIEGCEETHQYMLKEHLSKRGISPENYYRLNVEVGVGEFGMNEWNRIADISTGTRTYLARNEVQKMNLEMGQKMARIQRAIIRQQRAETQAQVEGAPPPNARPTKSTYAPPSNFAVELPGVDVPVGPKPNLPPRNPIRHSFSNSLESYNRPMSSGDDKFAVITSDEFPQVLDNTLAPPRTSAELDSTPRTSNDGGRASDEYSYVQRQDGRRSEDDFLVNSGNGGVSNVTSVTGPPPLPPKTPIMGGYDGRQQDPRAGRKAPLPYPDDDGPPPVPNMARKPAFDR
jgi:hypothetical protein